MPQQETGREEAQPSHGVSAAFQEERGRALKGGETLAEVEGGGEATGRAPGGGDRSCRSWRQRSVRAVEQSVLSGSGEMSQDKKAEAEGEGGPAEP